MRHQLLLALAVSLPALAQVSNLQLSTAGLSFTATAGASLPQSQIVGVSATGATLPVNVSVRYFTSTEGWITATADRASTPANITVTVNSANLAPGIYNGQVLVVASGSQSGLVTVTLTVNSGGSTGGLITANPASVSLASSSGQIVQSSVTLSSSGFVAFQIFATTTSGGSWLTFSSGSNTSPTTLTIIANTVGLATGTYSGTVSVAPTSGSAGVSIPVTLTIGSGGGIGGFSVSPSSLSFQYQTGAANPPAQSTFVNNANGIVSYVASSSVSWARLTSNITSTPAQTVTGTSNSSLTVYVDPSGLSPGFYNATITVNAASGGSQTLSVNLTVSGSSVLSANPSSFIFNYNPDTGLPGSQQAVLSASGTALSYTASASSTGWLLVGPQSGSTVGSNILTISVNPIGLSSGTYTGAVNVTSGANSLSIPVSLTVGVSGFNTISASPQALNFQAAVGSPAASQSLFLSASTTKNFVAAASTTGGSWLQVSPNSGTTPASLLVSIIPTAAGPAGTYNGQILISNLSDGSQLNIPVTMTLSGASLATNPQNLSFNLPSGSGTPVSQTVEISGAANTVFTASANTSWLSASPNTGTTPATINITANAASLTAGSYSGIVTINSGGVAVNVPVSLTVTSSSVPVITPSNLTFQSTSGSDAPPTQTINVNSTTGTLTFTVSSRTDSPVNWLTVAPSANSTPATVAVTVNPSGLAVGTYRGSITVSAAGGGDTRTAQVTFIVAAPTGPVLTTALHGATRQLSAITPGMILSLQGSALGSVNGANGTVTAAGAVETTLNGFRALFDGIPAPILLSSDRRMDIVVPYAIAGRPSTRVIVENAGARSGALDLSVSPDAAPGIFTLDGSGRGQAAALNENGSLNGSANPVQQSGVLVFFATGEGQTRPAGQDGRIIATDLRVPILPVAVNIGGVPVEVLYAGSAPQQVSGLMQINVRLNPDVPRGAAVPIELRVGPAPSQPGVTISIQ